MNAIQPFQIWIGFGLALLVILFLMATFFLRATLTDDQRQTLRFLCSLCSGFSAFFISGDALVKGDVPLGGGTQLAISGSAGFGLFMLVWFFYPRNVAVPADAFNFSVPDGWTFEQAVATITEADDAFYELEGFTLAQKKAPLRARALQAASVSAALPLLGRMCATSGFPRYEVVLQEKVYRLIVIKPK
jgi:hypothetical protein